MTDSQHAKCHAIIHAASAAAGAVGAGMAQAPCSDNLIIGPIQVTMTVSLAGVFGISLAEGAAMSALAASTSGVVGRAVSQVLLGWIPGVGNAINAATAVTITESAGWLLANDFARQCQEA